MIKSMIVDGVASYTERQSLTKLGQRNFVFGANGSGKTTLGRIIADPSKFPSCKVEWAGPTLECLVYNSDFVERNFNQSAELKGVFTLGEEQVEVLAEIEKTKAEVDQLGRRVVELEAGLKGKREEAEKLDTALTSACWQVKTKHDDALHPAFVGVRNSQKKFRDAVLSHRRAGGAELLTLDELEAKVRSIFGEVPMKEPVVGRLQSTELAQLGVAPILAKPVLGKTDVPIAEMIGRLGNSDWVRHGRTFHEQNQGHCPYCQQPTAAALTKELNAYFDETFLIETRAIEQLAVGYARAAKTLESDVQALVESRPKFLDVDALELQQKVLIAKLALNQQRIAEKKARPSQVVALESLEDVFKSLDALVAEANMRVAAHNAVLLNLQEERTTLVAQVWSFIVDELHATLEAHDKVSADLAKALQGLEKERADVQTHIAKKESAIRALEKRTTSVQPTMDRINALLISFGFKGFRLASASSGTSYRLERADGSNAKATLSEGEKSFVCFLYFFQLLQGSEASSGVSNDRVVVFDDPVSGLDSDILFIVASLIKTLFEEARAGGRVKQFFVLTHNVYFHKEVSFDRRRGEEALADETFWTVRKRGESSTLEAHATNPVKTSYQLLWSELHATRRSSSSIQNTMRRILDNYFRILGGYSYDEVCDHFEGNEKVICGSLCAWAHNGSHAHDELYVALDDAMVESYLHVFEAIFEKLGHRKHYEMMMQGEGGGAL